MENVEKSIYQVLKRVGKLPDETISGITEKIMEKTREYGKEIPPYNLIWMVITKETMYSVSSSQEMAKYILEMIETGTYKTELEKTIERINQMIDSK